MMFLLSLIHSQSFFFLFTDGDDSETGEDDGRHIKESYAFLYFYRGCRYFFGLRRLDGANQGTHVRRWVGLCGTEQES